MGRHQILFVFVFLCCSYSDGQSTCDKASDMVATIEEYHYEARSIDSNFVKQFYNILLERADGYGLLLSKQNVDSLRTLSTYLNDDIRTETCQFYETFEKILSRRIEESRDLLLQLDESSFVVYEDDSMIIDEGRYFVGDDQINKRWGKWLQYLTFKRVDRESFKKEQLDSIYHAVIELELCRINSYFINNDLEPKISSWYLSSIANTFDPHTSYFSREKKERFDIELSDENLSFGFELERNERGQLEVSSLIPGGAAWNSNNINEGDILILMITEGSKKDFSCISYADALGAINEKNISSAEFVFETENGLLDTINLKKTKISVQENIVQSFILNDSSSSVGYIYLPSFYSSENSYGLATDGCSADISREIIRLKKEGINGLILDLRGNGGGHMLEAINLIGIFINYGTLGILDDNKEKSSLIKDMNRGLIYGGPLTIMIDEFSASASEFLAVTLQDYNRAVIVGSTSFGKSTAQTVLPIEAHRYLSTELIDYEPKDFVKVTVNRFYRVNGETYQGVGVTPDIKFTSFYDGIEIGEDSYPTCLKPDHLERETYFSTYLKLPRKPLQEKFRNRQNENDYFKLVQELSDIYARESRIKTLSLKRLTEVEISTEYDKLLTNFYALKAPVLFEVNNPKYLAGYSSNLDSEKEINSAVMENISGDHEIIEAFRIIQDLININNEK